MKQALRARPPAAVLLTVVFSLFPLFVSLASCAAVLCAADTHCVNGTCVANKCDATNDCSETSYCGSAGTCVPRGTCEEALDCEKDPSFIHIMCAPGVFSCTDRRCGYTCTSTP